MTGNVDFFCGEDWAEEGGEKCWLEVRVKFARFAIGGDEKRAEFGSRVGEYGGGVTAESRESRLEIRLDFRVA